MLVMSTSSSLPLVAVVGATGQQGGSVVTHLLSSGRYRVRGITRDPASAAAVALKQRGVDVVQAQADSVGELTKAFGGAHAVYGVTNFWDATMKLDASKETQQGKNIADAAVAAGVKVVIWSSLHDSHAIVSQRHGASSEAVAHHFTSKHRVEQYIRKLPITSVSVYAGFYCNNFAAFPPFAPTRVSTNSVEWALPLRADVGLPMFDIADTGLYVLQILSNPEKFSGKQLLMATEYLTTAQIAAVYEKVTGESASSRVVPINPQWPRDIATSYRWFNEFGYYNGERIEHLPTLPRTQLTSWEQYLVKSKWRVPQQ